jgi:hypothetical protein
VPPFVVTATATVLFWLLYARDLLDHPDGIPSGGAFGRYAGFDPAAVSDGTSALAGTTVAVLGIVITVVSIIVQLSAGRYAGVTRMFLRDRINLAILAYYVIVCVFAIWTSLAVGHGFVPKTALLALLIATSGGLALMAPYFGYVFRFLEPRKIIVRIRRHAEAVTGRGMHESKHVERAQADVVSGVEELTDIVSSSISNKDKLIASAAVDALRDFALGYAARKASARAAWFAIGKGIERNPDLVAMDPESLADLERRRTWVVW